jgi:hypothetical protein
MERHEAIPKNKDDNEAREKPDKAGQAEVRREGLHRLLVVKGCAHAVSGYASDYGKSKLQ